jgi:hypothetical protein
MRKEETDGLDEEWKRRGRKGAEALVGWATYTCTGPIQTAKLPVVKAPESCTARQGRSGMS